jgi:ornithine cyclodeaminase/alanine dehydrogenase
MPLLITEKDIEGLFSIEQAIPVVEEAFRMSGEGTAENPPRYRMPIRKGFLQFGPAVLHSKGVMGFKLWANFGTPLRGVWNFLFSLETSELLAIIQAHLISKCRTSAVTAVGTRHLSPDDVSTVGMYGSGRQAEAQLAAICRVRPIRRAVVYSRESERRLAFARKMSAQLGIEVVAADAPEKVPQGAGIVVTITNTETPVLRGEWVEGPCLVIGAGSNHWYEQEIAGSLVEKADLVVVDEREQAKVESGDLLWAAGHGLLSWDRVENLGHVVTGRVPVPPFESSLILFETHGLAITDVAVSLVAYELAVARGVGRVIEI